MVTLESSPVTLSTTLPGRTVAIKTAEVRPQVEGIIQERFFTQGAEVKAGQALYQIDPATYRAAFNKAQASYNSASATARRYEALVKSNAISRQVYDDAVSTAEQAKADLDSSKVNLEYANIKAPISGVIGRSLVTEGALVTSGQSSYLTTISQLDPIYVDLSESSRELLKLRRDLQQGRLEAVNDHQAAVTLLLEDGTVYSHEGKLGFSEVTVDNGTGSVTLRATFPNPDRALLPGMFVHAKLQKAVQENAILVPQEAIQHDNKGDAWVYVVAEQNKVERRTVELGDMMQGNWLVAKGLSAGDQVVVEGLQMINAGATVAVTEQTPRAEKEPKAALSMTDPSAR
ncbi:efflux RND transporter periplasmic adaptor subunit [Halioxenophilus aromaticivorans]|uniref:Efflux RND transporter periplasmic adaptor subunit n=1 Tax=Halioxenophilus aromaticivorans TaxID=1306992 RepID=A0AAV3U6E7_9ALTE